MSVITQEYDIDLKATGEYPVVKMSQFDTGSRTIVFTVYDGHELAGIDGMVARVDGTRSDGVEFSSTCTVGAGSKVSFTISQEMTKHAGKHAAELVIFDASGNPIGTQNFVIEVEAATMVRDSAASADDRTLYDQFTDSVSKTVADKISEMQSKYDEFSKSIDSKTDAMNKTAEDISGLVGASSKAVVVKEGTWTNINVTPNQSLKAILQYDPLTGLCVLDVRSTYKFDSLPPSGDSLYTIMSGIDAKYLPAESEMDAQCGSSVNVFPVYHDVGRNEIYLTREGNLDFRTWNESTQQTMHRPWAHVSWYARGGKYIGVTPVGTGGNTLTIGKTTTGEPGTQASVVNSGTAKDVVLDFTIPRGADGASGGGSSYTLPVATASTLGGVKIGSGISVTSDGTISASGGSGGLTLETVTVTEAFLSNSFEHSTANIGTLTFYKYGAFVGCRGYFSITPSGDFAGNITTNDFGFRLSSAISNGFSTDNGMKTVCFVSTEDNYLMRSVTDARPLLFHFNESYPSVDVEIPGVNLKANTTYYFQVDAVSLYFGIGNN